MTDEDPQQLKSTGGTPAELVRALRALRRDDRDAARLARVAERLGAKLAASGAPTGWLHSLTGTKIGLTGLLLGLGALGALGYALSANRSAPSVEVPRAPAPVAADAPQQAAPARTSEVAPAEAAAAPAPARAPVQE